MKHDIYWHEAYNSISASSNRSYIRKHDCTTPHFHKSFELIYVMDEALEATIDGIIEIAAAGEFLMVLPNQMHTYRNANGMPTRIWVCIIAEDYFPEFAHCMEGKAGTGVKFSCDAEIVEYMHNHIFNDSLLVDQPGEVGRLERVGVPLPTKTERLPPAEAMKHIFKLKACLHAICACYMEQIELVPSKLANNDLSYLLLQYVSEHFRENITLSGAAEALGYNYHYLSRSVHKAFGINFKQLVNHQRLEYAQNLMRGPKMAMEDVAKQSGFGSIRNFNQVFKELTGKTPREIE